MRPLGYLKQQLIVEALTHGAASAAELAKWSGCDVKVIFEIVYLWQEERKREARMVALYKKHCT